VDGFSDTFATISTQAGDFVDGAVNTTISTIGNLQKLSPASAYNTTHPEAYQQRMDKVGAAASNVVHHPITAIQSMVDNAGQVWSHDPGRALGPLLPAAVLGTVTGGAGDAAAVGTELAGASEEFATATAAAGQDAATAADAAGSASGTAVERSVAAVPEWGDFGPGAGQTDAAAAAGIQDSGTGLAQVDRDLAGIHLHPGPLDSSVSRTTPWGTFGGWDKSAGTAADSAAATQIEAAGTGLSQVERDLAGIHVNPAAAGDPSFSGRLVPDYLSPEYKAGDVARQDYRDRWPATAEDQRWLTNIRQDWPGAALLSNEELLALGRYTLPEGPIINTALRTGDEAVLAEVEPELRNMVSALNRLPNYQGPVERGLGIKPSDLDGFLGRYTPGATIREPGYTSTSTRVPYRGNVRFYINSVHGKDISPLLYGQNEVVFPPDTAFQVTGRRFDPQTKMWKIYLDDVGR
jgi:hypothetical protein